MMAQDIVLLARQSRDVFLLPLIVWIEQWEVYFLLHYSMTCLMALASLG